MPILMLTAADRLDDKVSGFGLGADDYLTKPLELAEFVLRLRALDRRRDHHRPPVREPAGLRLDPFRRQAYRDGRYEVRLAHCYNIRRATNTPVTIHHADGETTVRIDQQAVPEHDRLFRTLGTFRFAAGRKGWVRIANDGTDETKVAIADAVQWIEVQAAQ